MEIPNNNRRIKSPIAKKQALKPAKKKKSMTLAILCTVLGTASLVATAFMIIVGLVLGVITIIIGLIGMATNRLKPLSVIGVSLAIASLVWGMYVWGMNDGYNIGYDYGYSDGHDNGYISGYSDAPKGYTWFELENKYEAGFEDARRCAFGIAMGGRYSIYTCHK